MRRLTNRRGRDRSGTGRGAGERDPATDTRDRWNHNLHYHSRVVAAIPPGARSALDVGCGEGTLTRELSRIVPRVVGIDPDAASLDTARAQAGSTGVEYVCGDVLRHPFEEQFDVVTSVASLHHLDAATGLVRMRDLVHPGGLLAIIGCARNSSWTDLPFELAGVVLHRVHTVTRRYWQHPSPTLWPPPESYPEMKRLTGALLPGARFRRHALWRYSILWRRPLES